MCSQWLILGICGVTNGGKTTLTNKITELLPNTQIINQDDYFYPKDSGKHILIPELNHFNWEILSSLDMEKMFSDIQKLVNDGNNKILNINSAEILKGNHRINHKMVDISKNDIHSIQNNLKKYNIRLLIVEGFTIFNYQPIDRICHLKFYLTLTYDTCLKRRKGRVYDPADVPGYFEKVVWTEHLRHLEEVQRKCENVMFLDENVKNKCKVIFDYLDLLLKKIP